IDAEQAAGRRGTRRAPQVVSRADDDAAGGTKAAGLDLVVARRPAEIQVAHDAQGADLETTAVGEREIASPAGDGRVGDTAMEVRPRYAIRVRRQAVAVGPRSGTRQQRGSPEDDSRGNAHDNLLDPARRLKRQVRRLRLESYRTSRCFDACCESDERHGVCRARAAFCTAAAMECIDP